MKINAGGDLNTLIPIAEEAAAAGAVRKMMIQEEKKDESDVHVDRLPQPMQKPTSTKRSLAEEKKKPDPKFSSLTPKLETEIGVMVGNTKQSEESSQYGKEGFTSKITTYIKRIYYTAGLKLENLLSDSFTEEFKSAALNLASEPKYDFNKSLEFIMQWGDYGMYIFL